MKKRDLDLEPEQADTANRVPRDWARLSRCIAAGDSDAFEIYFEFYFQLMFDEARRLTNRDEASCLDIVQNSMLKVIKSIKPMTSEDHITAWTRVLVRCTTLDWLRQRANRLAKPIGDDVQLSREQIDSVDADARLIWIEDQLKQCDHSTRKMISLRYRLGWSLKRIAGKFGLKTGAVDGRIRRALDKIRVQAALEEIE